MVQLVLQVVLCAVIFCFDIGTSKDGLLLLMLSSFSIQMIDYIFVLW